MHVSRPSSASLGAALLYLIIGLAAPGGSAEAQGRGPSPVRWTAAAEQEIRSDVRLPGTVEADRRAVVAAEVQGQVIERRASEGDFFRRGAVLAKLDPGDLALRLEAAKGQLGEAAARRTRADHALTRARDLYERKLASTAELDEAVAEFRAWDARMAQLNAEIGRIELDLERCSIVAPFDGIVVAEMVERGEWLSVGSPVAEMLSLDDLQVRVEVAEHHFPRLRVGDAASVSISALPGVKLDGRIAAKIPSADPRARTFPVLVQVPNPDRTVAVGMLAEVALPLGAVQSAVLVPKDAVVRQGAQQFVWIVGEDDSVQQVGVEIGSGYGAWVIAHAGVSAGQRVVTRGNERLRPGMTVAGEPLEYELP